MRKFVLLVMAALLTLPMNAMAASEDAMIQELQKQIADLTVARMTSDYCQNWDRCPENGWGQCTPDAVVLAAKLKDDVYKELFSDEEIEIIKKLKMQRM